MSDDPKQSRNSWWNKWTQTFVDQVIFKPDNSNHCYSNILSWETERYLKRDT